MINDPVTALIAIIAGKCLLTAFVGCFFATRHPPEEIYHLSTSQIVRSINDR